MSEEHQWAVIHQRIAAYFYCVSVNGDPEGNNPAQTAKVQRFASAHYRAARRLMGLEGWE